MRLLILLLLSVGFPIAGIGDYDSIFAFIVGSIVLIFSVSFYNISVNISVFITEKTKKKKIWKIMIISLLLFGAFNIFLFEYFTLALLIEIIFLFCLSYNMSLLTDSETNEQFKLVEIKSKINKFIFYPIKNKTKIYKQSRNNIYIAIVALIIEIVVFILTIIFLIKCQNFEIKPLVIKIISIVVILFIQSIVYIIQTLVHQYVINKKEKNKDAQEKIKKENGNINKV